MNDSFERRRFTDGNGLPLAAWEYDHVWVEDGKEFGRQVVVTDKWLEREGLDPADAEAVFARVPGLAAIELTPYVDENFKPMMLA